MDNKGANTNESLEKIEDFSEGDLMIKELEKRLKEIEAEESTDEVVALTLWDRLKGFILPVIMTILALLLTLLLLYFFANSKKNESVTSITNTGDPEEVVVATNTPIIIEDNTKITCTEPQILNEDGSACIDEISTATPTQATTTLPALEEGTTTTLNVRFSYDKINYDLPPRGFYLNKTQEFEGEYAGFRFDPSNRPYANDFMFGVDRYMVSLIGDCNYTIDSAKIVVKNTKIGNKSISGRVWKVVSSSKPHIVCNQ